MHATVTLRHPRYVHSWFPCNTVFMANESNFSHIHICRVSQFLHLIVWLSSAGRKLLSLFTDFEGCSHCHTDAWRQTWDTPDMYIAGSHVTLCLWQMNLISVTYIYVGCHNFYTLLCDCLQRVESYCLCSLILKDVLIVTRMLDDKLGRIDLKCNCASVCSLHERI